MLEIRLPHVETGFAGRAVLGTPPVLANYDLGEFQKLAETAAAT
ncbi:hypothetical protein AB0D33_13470 [Streptomyces sp. NPDC048404]